VSLPATRFIDPAVLARLSSMELLARSVVEGFLAGLHQSPYKGFSVDFMQYRPYVPGDDLQRVDWKVYARTDRYFVKEYQGETNTRVHIVLDTSGSMGFASTEVSKLKYACYLAASVAYLANRQRDAAGLTLFDRSIGTYCPPRVSRTHLLTLLTALGQAAAGTATDLDRSLGTIAEQQRKRGFIVLISDLLTDIEAVEKTLSLLRYAGHNVLVFQVMDPMEISFDYKDVVEFRDLESGRRMLIDATSARAEYRQRYATFQDRLKKVCGLLQVDRAVLRTDQPLDRALFHYLSARSKRRF